MLVLFDREGWLIVVEGPAGVADAVEANDVEAGEFVGLDADGRVLELSVRYGSGRPAALSLQAIEVGISGERVEPEDLRALLAEALGDADEGAPISDLLREAKERSELHAPRTAALLRRLA